MSVYAMRREMAERAVARLAECRSVRAQAAGRALAQALAQDDDPDVIEVALSDEHWGWIIDAAA